MSLCEQCNTIQFDKLPSFPNHDEAARTLSGLPYYHQAFFRKSPLQDVGKRHYPDLPSVRDAAAAGCGLCRLISKEADAVIAEVRGMDARMRSMYSEPRFDLWLTKLPLDRPGFMVLTNSRGGRHQSVHPIAAIGFCAEQDDPLASSLVGRPVFEVPSEDALNRVASWVKNCDGHKSCTRSPKSVPARLLDVGSADQDGPLRIVQTAGQNIDRYIALSHRYKHRDIAQADLLPASQESVELPTLFKTFRDAVAITRRLGVRYLWIDEICIAREDVGDWGRDSPNMAAVFSNTYLALAATGAADLSEGLLLPRKAREYVSLDHTATDGRKGQMKACALPLNKEFIESYYVDMDSEPLSKDVWAFQDRVLAPRTLHFAGDQIYLECQDELISEDGLQMSYGGLHGGSKFGGIPEGSEEARIAWHGLLWAYGRRFPDDPADKLLGIANVARAYAEVLKDEYIAGLWKGSLLEGMCWQSLRRKDIEEPAAPSFSWASFGGIAAGGFIKEREEWVPMAKVLDYHVETEKEDPFGGVKEAWLRLEAPLVPVEVAEKLERTNNIFLRSTKAGSDTFHAGLDLIKRDYDVSAEKLRGMKLYCMVLGITNPSPEFLLSCSSGGCRPSSTCRCILVAPTEDGKDMRRIGFALVGSEDLDYQNAELLTTVTLR
ncbi:hypothetical protein GQ53DRAFT_812370 [Thozetella sp. PMI_491]|nr:hypothetical protein GQ53DRAFT_812370 [Thozetella sp. PMI_491]